MKRDDELHALLLEPRATQPHPQAWTLAQAVQASPLIALVHVLDPPQLVTQLPTARKNTLALQNQDFTRVQQRFLVERMLRGDLTGEVLVDQPHWQRTWQVHRERVLHGRQMTVSLPWLREGLQGSAKPGEQVIVLARRTPAGLELTSLGAILHLEQLAQVEALLQRG